jgi:hypothetical protein
MGDFTEYTLPDLAPLDRQMAHIPSKRVPVYESPPNANIAWWIYAQQPAPQEDVVHDEGHTNYTNDSWGSEIFNNGFASILYNVPLNDTKAHLATKPVVSQTLVSYDRILFILSLLLVIALIAKYTLC